MADPTIAPQVVAPGPFIGPGAGLTDAGLFVATPWPASDDAAAPVALASPGAQDNSTQDPSQQLAPGLFISPGSIAFPGPYLDPQAQSSPAASSGASWSFGGGLTATASIDAVPVNPLGGTPTPDQIPAVQAPRWTP